MGLRKERFFSLQHPSESLPSLPEKIEVFRSENVSFPNAQEQLRLSEVYARLTQEQKRVVFVGSRRLRDNNGFEPFTNASDRDRNLFVNDYDGNYCKDMELNREMVERVLKIVHLDGQIFLTRYAPTKGLLFRGPQIKKKQREVSDYRVVNIGEKGWNIQVNDRKIIEDLERKRLNGEELKRDFIKKFNGVLKDALFESIVREKLSGEKMDDFLGSVLASVSIPLASAFAFQAAVRDISRIAVPTFVNSIVFFALIQTSGRIFGAQGIRKLDSFWEYFMPPVEIDKVARAYAFLKGKGQNLVKDRDAEINSA